MSNIIDKIQLSGVTYDIGGSGGGNPTVELTQAEYDALVSAGTVSADTYYIITDVLPVDVSNYYTTAQTQSAITQATSGKVDTNTYTAYTAATNSALASKQTRLTAGTNISVTTGETADTINCTLPITAETSSNKCIIKIGEHLNVSNSANYEWAIGRYNVTRSVYSGSWANSGNTAFSIGIGTPWNSYNGLEVRQNGDVYIADTRTGTYPYEYKMIKLQDAVAALDTKQTTLTASTGIDITNDVISVTGMVAASSITTALTSSSTDVQVPSAKAVYDQMGGLKIVKLTQSSYDALSPNYDSNTLYVIVN